MQNQPVRGGPFQSDDRSRVERDLQRVCVRDQIHGAGSELNLVASQIPLPQGHLECHVCRAGLFTGHCEWEIPGHRLRDARGTGGCDAARDNGKRRGGKGRGRVTGRDGFGQFRQGAVPRNLRGTRGDVEPQVTHRVRDLLVHLRSAVHVDVCSGSRACRDPGKVVHAGCNLGRSGCFREHIETGAGGFRIYTTRASEGHWHRPMTRVGEDQIVQRSVVPCAHRHPVRAVAPVIQGFARRGKIGVPRALRSDGWQGSCPTGNVAPDAHPFDDPAQGKVHGWGDCGGESGHREESHQNPESSLLHGITLNLNVPPAVPEL